MKRLLITMLVSIFICSTVFPQIPQAFKYQSVVRNSTGDILSNLLVSFQISIHTGTASGSIEYQETHPVLTNSFGVANLNVGEGLVVSGVFADIDWAASDKFMEVELDPSGGSAYVVMGTTQLVSVPFALYADKSGSALSIADTDGDTYIEVEETPNDDIIRFYNGGTQTYQFNGKNIQVFDPDLNVLLGQGTGTNLVAGTAVRNTFVGHQSGFMTTEGKYNTFMGYKAGNNNSTGELNSFYGDRAGVLNTEGSRNTFMGYYAGYGNTIGEHNTFSGYKSGESNKDGSRNAFIGYLSGHTNIHGDENLYVGYMAGYSDTVSENHFIGYQAGYENRNGEFNTFIGHSAGMANQTGNENLFVGYQAGLNNNASGNLFMGYQAGYHNTAGFGNTFIGKEAGSANTDTDNNTFIGFHAGLNNIAGSNTFIGREAGLANENGGGNTFIGTNAGYVNLDGKENCFVGAAAGGLNTSGEYNTYIGTLAGMWNQGSNNVYIGYGTGSNTGNNNVFIGYYAGFSETGSNKLYISNNNVTGTPLIYGEFDNGKVTINDVLKLAPRSSAPSPAEEGMIYYDDTSKQLYYYNGTSWIPL